MNVAIASTCTELRGELSEYEKHQLTSFQTYRCLDLQLTIAIHANRRGGPGIKLSDYISYYSKLEA